MAQRKLEIGGERHPKEGYEQLDIRSWPGVTHVCDARRLPFLDETFKEVYSSQTLEHFGRSETKEVLLEWLRVVEKEGRLILDLPDFYGMYKDYTSGKNTWEHFVERLYGTQDYEENTHYTMFTQEEFEKMLEHMGLRYESSFRFASDGGFHIEILKT